MKTPLAFFGLAGESCFNRPELERADRELAKKEICHWIEIFEGGHSMDGGKKTLALRKLRQVAEWLQDTPGAEKARALAAVLEKDPDLDSLREMPEFQDLLD